MKPLKKTPRERFDYVFFFIMCDLLIRDASLRRSLASLGLGST